VETESQQEEDLTSRSDLRRARKAEEDALSRLARDLAALSARNLAALELDEGILDAVEHARALSSPPAVQRQLRVVRSALRAADWPVLRARVEQLRVHGTATLATPSDDGLAQRWLVRLLGEGEGALSELVEAHPSADPKYLGQLVRSALGSSAARRKRVEAKLTQNLKLLIRQRREKNR
jgi:ribosome-associated protein